MVATYGEKLLEQAERQKRAGKARKRLVRVLVPASVVIVWAMLDLLSARNARLDDIDAGFVRTVLDHGQVIAWTILFVLVPFGAALKPDPMIAGAALAWFAGPIVTPLLFGPGGWKLWQILLMTLFTALVLSAHRERRAART